MAQGDDGRPRKKRARLIARLGAILIMYANQVSVLCCLAGLVSLLLLPVLAKNTYISENALMPGSAKPRFSNQDMWEANRLAKDIMNLKLEFPENHRAVPSLLVQHMLETGADAYFHKFFPSDDTFEPLCFLTDSSHPKIKEFNGNSSVVPGVNAVGIIRAPRGDGKEAIVLVSHFQSDSLHIEDALSLGLGFSLFHLLSRADWLAKDIVWLVADSRYGAHAAVAAWLRDYHEPVFYLKPDLVKDGQYVAREKVDFYQLSNYNSLENFQRAGTIAAAVIFHVREFQMETVKGNLNIYAEASNGQMPNLDLINIVNYLAIHRQGLVVTVESMLSVLSWGWLTTVGRILEGVGKVAGMLNPEWKFGLPAWEYVQGAATLASSIYNQALGVPTGAHGAFRDYQVDAITLEMLPNDFLENEIARASFLLKLGRLLEGIVRSINNLLEKFHQSFFLYFLTSPSRFISVGVYMIPFALLVIPLPILAAALCSYKNVGLITPSSIESSPSEREESEATDMSKLQSITAVQEDSLGVVSLCLSLNSWKWLDAAKVVLLIHLWAAVVAMIPCVIDGYLDHTPGMKLLTWVILSCLSLLVVYGVLGFPSWFGMQKEAAMELHIEGWVALKAFTLGAVTIGLGIMSVVNFAAALLGAIILVPMCLSIYPLKYVLKTNTMMRILLILLITSFTIFASPPIFLVAFRGLSDRFHNTISVDIWEWTKRLWFWHSATYLYLLLVHLPCWVLCFNVLLYV